MRANKLGLAAALLMTAIQPVLADDLLADVHETLYRPYHHGLLGGLFGGMFGGLFGGAPACGVMTRPAVVAAPGCMAGACQIDTQPAVVTQSGACGAAAILTRDPSDLDIRRQELERKIACLGGGLGACRTNELGASIAEINRAELAFRSDGYLDIGESRRLYKAMDRLGAHVDRWSNGWGWGSWIGLAPGFWY